MCEHRYATNGSHWPGELRSLDDLFIVQVKIRMRRNLFYRYKILGKMFLWFGKYVEYYNVTNLITSLRYFSSSRNK